MHACRNQSTCLTPSLEPTPRCLALKRKTCVYAQHIDIACSICRMSFSVYLPPRTVFWLPAPALTRRPSQSFTTSCAPPLCNMAALYFVSDRPASVLVVASMNGRPGVFPYRGDRLSRLRRITAVQAELVDRADVKYKTLREKPKDAKLWHGTLFASHAQSAGAGCNTSKSSSVTSVPEENL